MTSRKALIDVLLQSGISTPEEAADLAALNPANGNTWTSEVLNTEKVDEVRFAQNLAALFKASTANVESAKVDRAALGLLPSRFVFKHQILPLEVSETSVKL